MRSRWPGGISRWPSWACGHQGQNAERVVLEVDVFLKQNLMNIALEEDVTV